MKKLLSLVLVLMMLFTAAAECFAFSPQDPGNTVTVSDFGYIDNKGNLWLWGPNECEQAGVPVGDTWKRWVDEPHKVMSDVVSFSRGTQSTIVLQKDGSVWEFGHIFDNGVLVTTSIPKKVLDGCIAVSAGYTCSGALKADGSLYTWGVNEFKQTGQPSYSEANHLPDDCYAHLGSGAYATLSADIVRPVKLMDDVAYFQMNHATGYAIKKNGDVYYWGDIATLKGVDYNGKMPPGPTKLWEGANASQIDMQLSEYAIYVKNTKGELWGWGLFDGSSGTRGKRYYFTQRSKFTDNVKYLVGGLAADDGTHNIEACVIKNDGGLYIRNGAEKIADNVNAAVMDDMVLGGYKCKMILYNDGTLVALPGTTSHVNDGALFGDSLTESKVIATDVALSHQPFSSIGKPAVKDTVGPFTDVHTYDWYADTVKWAVDAGITEGTDPTHFNPSGTCTNGHILTFLWRANGSPSPKGRNPYHNVKNDQWYTDACIWAYERGIVKDLDLNPTANCLRINAADYIYRATVPETYDIFADPRYKIYVWEDVPSAYTWEANWLRSVGITDGVYTSPGGKIRFGSNQTCNRAQIVTFLYRAYVEPAQF